MHDHAPPGYECLVCAVVAGDRGGNVVVMGNELAVAP